MDSLGIANQSKGYDKGFPTMGPGIRLHLVREIAPALEAGRKAPASQSIPDSSTTT